MASSNPRLLTGVVISDKADKTITVKVERKVRHPLYGKIMKRTTKVHAHDESNAASTGDIVTVKECRPISKSKTWVLVTDQEMAATSSAVNDKEVLEETD
jgi:small subunit ribosomal protein S17